MAQIHTQICVLGAGAGGTGCVYRLIQNGIHTVVVDKNPDFGGTAVYCGVDGWEPGVSLDGLHQKLYEAMAQIPLGCHIVTQVPNDGVFCPRTADNWDGSYSFAQYPWALARKCSSGYQDTFQRRPYRFSKRLQFEPAAMTNAIHTVLAPYAEHLETLFDHHFVSCKTCNGQLISITVSDGSEETEIFADYFVDATGDIVLARAAGCQTTIGTEGYDAYQEPSAGDHTDIINGVSFVFRIAKVADKEYIDPVPLEYASVDIGDFNPHTVSYMVEYPNGDFNVNMLPTMQGQEYLALGERAQEVGRAMIWAYWHYLQTKAGMKGYSLIHIYDAGVRESYRLVGKYVLTERDLRAGHSVQPTIGRTVAIADHALDVHGKGSMGSELDGPYEIPVECSMTKEYQNLFVSCRGASFTHIAASSARLTRTMLSMGEGVGMYIAQLISSQNG